MGKLICVYKIDSISSGNCCYVGSTRDYLQRVRNHKCQLKKGKHPNPKLNSHVSRFGLDDLMFQIIECCSIEEMRSLEDFYINRLNPSFNSEGNALGKGRKSSEEVRKKLSEVHKGIYPTKENLLKRSLSMKNKLKHLTKEEKVERIAKANRSIWRRVICNETGMVYDSVAIAERETGCDNVTRICKTGRGTSRGLTFKYIEDGL